MTETIVNCFVGPSRRSRESGNPGLQGLVGRPWGPALAGATEPLHLAQFRDREQSRQAHWPIGLLEPPRETGQRDNIAGAANARATALAVCDQHRLAEARPDRRSVADMDMNE